MKRLSTLLLAGLAVAAVTGSSSAEEKTEISVSRFFGACEADYGSVTTSPRPTASAGSSRPHQTSSTPRARPRPSRSTSWNGGYDQLTARIRSGERRPSRSCTRPSSRTIPRAWPARAAGRGLQDGRDRRRRHDGRGQERRHQGRPDLRPALRHPHLALARKSQPVQAGRPSRRRRQAILPKNADELLAQAAQFKEKTGKPYFVSTLANETAFYTEPFDTLLYQQNSDFFAIPIR